jgi:hypothetical protein
MRAFLASVVVLASIAFAFAVNADATAHTSPALPSIAAALPDTLPLPFDWSAYDAAHASEASAPRIARTVRALPSVAAAPSKVWTCDAPRGLASDATATVRVCEYR